MRYETFAAVEVSRVGSRSRHLQQLLQSKAVVALSLHWHNVAAFQAAEQEEFDDPHVDDEAGGPMKTCGAASAV